MTKQTRREYVWGRLSGIYGPLWKPQQYNPREWDRALERLDTAHITRAIDSAIKEHKYPPNLAEFVQLAKQHAHGAHKLWKRQPEKPRNPEAARQALREIKKLVG